MQPKEIFESDLPHRSVSVWLYLHSRANNANQCFPSIKRIGTDLKLSVSTVKRAVNDLEKIGYIKKGHRFRENGGKSSNIYTLK